MIPNAQNLISSAIRNRRRLLIRYDGKERSRVIEPHLLYRSQHGELRVLAYQVRGYRSKKRTGNFWRPFRLTKIDHIYVTGETFECRTESGYSTVVGTVSGVILERVEATLDRYSHFEPALFGPPTPAYLAATPSQMIRLAGSGSV